MPPRPFVNDGLWRCLCPGFPPTARAPTLSSNHISLRNASSRNAATPRWQCQRRTYSTPSTPFPSNDASFFAETSAFPKPFQHRIPQQRSPPDQGRSKEPLARLPTRTLYERARIEGAKGHFDGVMNICRVLIKDRGEQPNKEMYTAILHSFVDSVNGTAGKVRKVLEEMGFWNDADGYASEYASKPARIELDARGCECVLEALAVHPDYLLRSEILDYMRSRWFTLSHRGQNFVVAGMLRERHFEHALEMLDDMVKKQVRVEDWLFDKAMWMLLEFEEVEEAFYILSLKEGAHRSSGNGAGNAKLSDALWGTLLDAAGEKQLYTPVSMIWMTQVQPGYLKPGTGACLSVLMLASRHGDVQLATDVFRVLTERATTLTSHHYELLIATYLKANDLPAALSVILIMVDASLKVDAGTCNPLFVHLCQENEGEESRPMHAFTLLQESEVAGRKVPTAAINACMQASIALDRFEEAIEFYKALHTVAHAGPNTQTFNVLFRGCRLSARKELAMFFANEMIHLDLKPDQITYDRLILVCCEAGDLEDALLYYEEMVSTSSSQRPMKPRRKTWELLITKCVRAGDERAVALLKAYKEGVEEPRMSVEKAVVQRFEYRNGGGEETLSKGREHGPVAASKEGVEAPDSNVTARSLPGKVGEPTPQISTAHREVQEDGLTQLMRASKSTKPY